MATNPRLEQLKSALVAADKAGATEDARRLAEAIRLEQATQQALQAEEFNRQQGFELQPKTAEEIKVAQDRAVAEAERFRDERRVGLSRIAGQSLSGAIEAAPSGVAAAGQAGVANVLEEGRNRSLFDIEPSLLARAIPGGGGSVVETAQNLAGNIAGRLTSPETDAALRERSAENLQETLAIRARNAEEAKRLRQQYVDQGGSGVAADIAGALGSSATSFAPLAGAAVVGAVTRNPMAALATQRGLAVLPATQAYADAYAQFKSEYPDAPDSEAHRYAASMATVEFGVEALVPAGGSLTGAGARQVAGAIARRTATEAGTEAVTELAGQGIQLGLAPNLAPDSLEEAAYNAGIAAATGGLAGGAISVPTTFAEARGVANEARLQEQKRLAELRAVDEKLAEGAAVAQELPAVAQAERAIAELMSNLPEGGLDLETRRGEASTLLDTTPVIEEPAGPSSPFLPRSERVNLEVRQGEASTILDVPAEVVAEPQGPVSVLPGVRPQEALALDTPRGEASPIEGPEATRMRFEAQRVDAEEQTAFLQNEKQTLLQNPTRENRVRVKEIDRELGRQAIRRAVAVNALSNPPSVQSAPVETPAPELPLTRQARVSTLEEARSLSQPITQPEATTPAPLPQTAPTAPLTRAERVAQQRTVAEQVLNPVTGQMETVVEAAVSPDDTRRQQLEQFFSAPRSEPISAQEINKADEMAIRPDGTIDEQINIIPKTARRPSEFEQRLTMARTARDAMKVIKTYAKEGSPFAKVIESLERSPFLDNTAIQILQPEDKLPTGMQRSTVRGAMQRYGGGNNKVFLRGSGFRINGTNTPEVALHEIVHAASVDLIEGVGAGRITDPKAVASVKQIDLLRKELEASLKDKETRSGLTPEERVNLDYATTNSKEFVSQALSSTAVQSGLKKEGLWTRLVNVVRNMFRGPRSTGPLWEKIMDASLAVVDTQTEQADAVRASRREEELAYQAKQKMAQQDNFELPDADAADIRDTSVETARKQVLGQDRTVTSRLASKMSPFSKLGIVARKVDHTISRLFFSERGSTRTVEEVMGYKQGVLERVSAEAAPFVNRLRALLRQLPKEKRAEGASDIDRILKGEIELKDSKVLTREMGPSIDQVRKTIDKFTNEIGQEVVRSYGGRDMPKSTLRLLETLKANLGSYVARTYMSDQDKTFASDLWGRYKKGDESAVEVVQPLVNKLSAEIASLPDLLRKAREEAQDLSNQRTTFEPEDTFLGSELRRLYENYIGSSSGRTKEDMLSALTTFSNQAKDITAEAERVTQEIMGVGQAASPLSQYYRGLRSNDQPLRKRSAVPKEIRDVWGEITDPLLNAINTTQRMGALLSGLKASNMLAEMAPESFTERFNADSGQTFQIPNNPLAYGKLAGMYTDEGTFQLVSGQMEMAASLLYGKPLDAGKTGQAVGRFVAEKLAQVTSLQKMMSIVLNPFVAASNVFNVVYMPLVNGNSHPELGLKAAKIASRMVGSASRLDETDPELLEILEQGIIDPVLTQADTVLQERKQEARTLRKESTALNALADTKKTFFDTYDTLKETISFLETVPKIWNYLSHKETFKKMYPELGEADIKRLAAEETNRLNLTYARVPDVLRMTETAGISYVAGYMQQVLATSIYSVSSGARQAVEGIRSGNKELAMFGIKKLGGSVAGFTLASYIPQFVAEAMDWIDLSDEEDEDKQALLETLAFTERGMQPMIMGVTPEGVVTHTDVGRLNPYDSMHSVLRALVASSSAVARGDSEQAEANLKSAVENLAGQFAGGSPLGGLLLRTVQGKAPPSAMEADAKQLHDSIVLMGQEVGLPESATSNLVNAAWTFTPAFVRGIARAGQLERTNPEAFADNLVAGATMLRAPVRTHDPFNNLSRVAQFEYKPAVNRDNLREVLLLESNVSREQIERTVGRIIDEEAEAFNNLVQGVRAARYVGRLAKMPESEINNRIREGLEAGGIAKTKARSFVQETTPYEPTIIGGEWGKEAIETYLRGLPSREFRNQRRQQLEQRLALINEVVKEMQPRRTVTTTNTN